MTIQTNNRIIGAIIGDIVGSDFEFDKRIHNKFKLFRSTCSFTDDSVLTVAIADALLHGRSFGDAIWDWGSRYTYAGFGGSFRKWKQLRKSDPNATNDSKGNGSGMRATPIGFFAKSVDEAMSLAKKSAMITHNSPGGIAGAQSIAVAVFMAKEKRSKEEIRGFIEDTFGYNLHMAYDEIRRQVIELDNAKNTLRQREWAENTCPLAIMAFLYSTGYEDAIRKAVSYGGDVDTIACMAGGIAAAYYGVPQHIINAAARFLPKDIIAVVNEFDGLNLENRETPAMIDRWAKRGHVLVYGSGPSMNNESRGFLAKRRFRSMNQLEGLCGDSYAIPTVGATLEEVKAAIGRFTEFVAGHPELEFIVTDIGCTAKAGFTPTEIAPMFKSIAAAGNVYLPGKFREVIVAI